MSMPSSQSLKIKYQKSLLKKIIYLTFVWPHAVLTLNHIFKFAIAPSSSGIAVIVLLLEVADMRAERLIRASLLVDMDVLVLISSWLVDEELDVLDRHGQLLNNRLNPQRISATRTV